MAHPKMPSRVVFAEDATACRGGVAHAKRLEQLDDENRRLKQIVAELSLDLQAAKR